MEELPCELVQRKGERGNCNVQKREKNLMHRSLGNTSFFKRAANWKDGKRNIEQTVTYLEQIETAWEILGLPSIEYSPTVDTVLLSSQTLILGMSVSKMHVTKYVNFIHTPKKTLAAQHYETAIAPAHGAADTLVEHLANRKRLLMSRFRQRPRLTYTHLRSPWPKCQELPLSPLGQGLLFQLYTDTVGNSNSMDFSTQITDHGLVLDASLRDLDTPLNNATTLSRSCRKARTDSSCALFALPQTVSMDSLASIPLFPANLMLKRSFVNSLHCYLSYGSTCGAPTSCRPQSTFCHER